MRPLCIVVIIDVDDKSVNNVITTLVEMSPDTCWCEASGYRVVTLVVVRPVSS